MTAKEGGGEAERCCGQRGERWGGEREGEGDRRVESTEDERTAWGGGGERAGEAEMLWRKRRDGEGREKKRGEGERRTESKEDERTGGGGGWVMAKERGEAERDAVEKEERRGGGGGERRIESKDKKTGGGGG